MIVHRSMVQYVAAFKSDAIFVLKVVQHNNNKTNHFSHIFNSFYRQWRASWQKILLKISQRGMSCKCKKGNMRMPCLLIIPKADFFLPT